ncbi:hypothetical protein [Synechococcus sp. EJ6-Ellesmere]|uniref:hypothetical protein n=1 Tax=Synechococcus sp. EJ6-Ellesmere TaxID=2823734 RepID=UPI0020CBEA6E|nr:hypothetical protein [Synechococcus sp. EJ6-Ellesmere]MCP9823893.1 hypothetical protein [Synechococcus sp. EJ6-Ellesmere]
MPRTRKPHPAFARPLLASRERPGRRGGPVVVRALFLLHAVKAEIVGAFHQGDQLDAEKALALWSAHRWQQLPQAGSAPVPLPPPGRASARPSSRASAPAALHDQREPVAA